MFRNYKYYMFAYNIINRLIPILDIFKMNKYKAIACPGLDVDLYQEFLPKDTADTWLQYLEQIIPCDNRRTSVIFGDKGKKYVVNFMHSTRITECLPWESIPSLSDLKGLIEATTGQKYTVCVIQRYPSGLVGIAPHRDKEMIEGTMIVGLSLGATRTLSFSSFGQYSISMPLPSGSLYVMNHPTNQYWLHSIVPDPNITTSRISLTFRNY